MILETKRLILRPFIKEDVNDVFEYLKEPLVNCFACMKLNSLEETYKLLEERNKDTEYTFAIVLKENNKVIGEIEAHPESTSPIINGVLDTFSPCWMLNKKYHGKGYAYEASEAFFDYLFIEPLMSKDTRFLFQRITNEILSTSVTSGSSYPRYI